MADKTIDMLQAATAVGPNDLFVLQQSATAKKLTGQILENWLVALADGHGGIQSISKTSTSGFVDTYTIVFADTTTSTFTVTNGKSMTGVTIYYAVSNSDSTAPASGWSTSYQQMTQTNRFLWSYEVIAFNDNTSITTEKVVIGVYGQKGDTGATGNGIASMSAGTHTPGSYTIYTFTFTDGTEQSFYSYDGVGISSIAKTSTVGLVDTYTITYTDNTATTFTVTNAKSITTVSKTGTSGLVDTYTVAFNDGTSTTFTVTNGASISSITKTSTVGLVDTYTVALTDGTSTTFTVTNAKSIVSVTQTSGTHAAGTTDVYTITFNDGDTTTFSVYNGANGTGAVSSVDGIQPDGNQNVTLLLTGNGAPTTSTVGVLYQRYFDLASQILYICVGINTSSTPATYTWAGTGVPVDSSLSTSSENPVQNKVITAKVGTTALTTTATDLSGAVNELNANKYQKPSGGIPASDLAAGVIPTVPSAYASNPADLGSAASPGSSANFSRGDHVHKKPSPADIGAQASITASGILKGNGSGGVSAAVEGTDYQGPLGITGATAGQYVEITSVDANGKPTGYAAATPSGAASLNAGAHNGVYRGQYLGSSVTAAQWAAISAGAFEDLYIGDYWTIGGINYRIAAFDYWLRTGDTECTAHHVVIVPDTALYNAKMNDSDVTTGAYIGSKMYSSNLATAKTTINSAFGSAHILNHREHLQNAVTNGYESAGTWYDSTVDLMNEKMVYGCDIFHSMSHGADWANHYTIDKCQLPLFALDPSKIAIRASWWLRDVASSTLFCSVYSNGVAAAANASASYGVRPAFGIVA